MTQSSFKTVSIILISTVAIWLLLSYTKVQPGKTETLSPAPIVTSTIAHYQNQPEMIIAYGKVEPLDPVAIDGEINAKIRTLSINNGSKVSRGDVIATFDKSDFIIEKATLEESVSQNISQTQSLQDQINSLNKVIEHDRVLLENAQDLLKRYRKLSPKFQSQKLLNDKEDAVSQRTQSHQQNQSLLSSLEHQLKQANQELSKTKYQLLQNRIDIEHTELKSPQDGIITNLVVVVGDYVKKGDAFATIIDPAKTYLHAFIPSQYYTQLSPGLSGHIKDNPEVQVTLDGFDHLIKDKSAHIDGRFYYKDPSKPIYAMGQIIPIAIELPLSKPTVKVPESSIYQNIHIYRIKDQQLEQLDISILGLTFNAEETGYLIHSANLTDGDAILTTRLTWPKTGLVVRDNA